jgi:hypothetical protein
MIGDGSLAEREPVENNVHADEPTARTAIGETRPMLFVLDMPRDRVAKPAGWSDYTGSCSQCSGRSHNRRIKNGNADASIPIIAD